MKKYLAMILFALSTTPVALAADVTGVWRSSESSGLVSPGTLTLQNDGVAMLAPDGFEPLKGTYTADGKFIDIVIADMGKAALAYTRKGSSLTIEYENGSVQHFTKTESKLEKKKKK